MTRLIREKRAPRAVITAEPARRKSERLTEIFFSRVKAAAATKPRRRDTFAMRASLVSAFLGSH